MQAVPIAPEPEPNERLNGLDSLTAAETAMAERQAAQSITTLGNERHPQAQLIGALGWVLHRRTHPSVKFNDYMSGRTLTDITRELGLSTPDADDDDDAEGDDAGKDSDTNGPSISPS